MLALLAGLLADPAALPAGFDRQAFGSLTITKPAASELTLAAGEPLIKWPVAADWDGDDLLVVEMNWTSRESVTDQLESRPHRIVRLTDTDGDGTFDRRQVAAGDLPFTAGLLVTEHGVLVAAPPKIWRLTDTDADGTLDAREVWHDGGTITYCANDLHGPFRSPDGWIYWTKGAFAEQVHQTPDGPVRSEAAHVLRRRPSGGPVEIVCSAGMDNPAGLAFLTTGEPIFCGTYFHHPGRGLRDGIAVAVQDAVYGKPNAVLRSIRQTGPLWQPLVELGPAAPADLCRVAPDYATAVGMAAGEGDLLASADFNLQRVSLHRITSAGDFYEAASGELLRGSRVDFHPVDTVVDSDGSLLVLDTGGWYDLCCPSSGVKGQVAPGGIYRLRLPDGVGESVVGSVDADRVRMHQASVDRDAASVPPLRKALESDDPILRRRMIEATGRVRLEEPLPADLTADLTAVAAAAPKATRHAATITLMSRGHRGRLRTELASADAARRRVALRALAEAGDLGADDASVLSQLAAASDTETRSLAVAELTGQDHYADRLPGIVTALSATGNDTDWRAAVAIVAASSDLADYPLGNLLAGGRPERVTELLTAVAGRPLPDHWDDSVASVVDQPEALPDVLPPLRSIPLAADSAVARSLRRATADGSLPNGIRLLAAAALPPRTPVDEPTAELVVEAARRGKPVADRALDRVQLPKEALPNAANVIRDLPASRLRPLLAATLASSDREFRDRLLERLPAVDALRSVAADDILRDIPKAEQPSWRAMLQGLQTPPAEVAAEVEAILDRLDDGDPVLGADVFRDARVACSKCHRVGFVGGQTGPELTRIGQSRTRRDLLEAIVAPSARIEQSYHMTSVLTDDGRLVTGIVRSETPQTIELVCGIEEVCRIPTDRVEARRRSEVSLMPQGLHRQISEAELADLLAYLESLQNPWD